MEQIWTFADDRLTSGCVYCGANPDTREHVPSKVLLDEPYPENVPVVPSCFKCNNGFSADEAYLACLIDCARTGSAEPTKEHRPKVRNILRRDDVMAAKLRASRSITNTGIEFAVELERIRRVLRKLAAGHVLFEAGESVREEPAHFAVLPLGLLSAAQREVFEAAPDISIWPEVGTRAMQRAACGYDLIDGWVQVQPNRYRYLVVAGGEVTVRIVLSEYLACELIWD